jgi:hypothetical protein
MTRAVLLATTLWMLACAGAPPPPARMVSFRMKGTPPNATVTVDDIHVGPLEVVQKRGLALPAGQHRVTVEAPGFFPYDKLVNAEDRPISLEVSLVPIPE